MRSIGKIIKKQRMKIGMKQIDLANKIGYDTPHLICNVERGVIKLPIKKIKNVSKALNLNPEVFYKVLEKEYSKKIRTQ